jgi:hypothetical protein
MFSMIYGHSTPPVVKVGLRTAATRITLLSENAGFGHEDSSHGEFSILGASRALRWHCPQGFVLRHA